jgi:hypothetical protein
MDHNLQKLKRDHEAYPYDRLLRYQYRSACLRAGQHELAMPFLPGDIITADEIEHLAMIIHPGNTWHGLLRRGPFYLMLPPMNMANYFYGSGRTQDGYIFRENLGEVFTARLIRITNPEFITLSQPDFSISFEQAGLTRTLYDEILRCLQGHKNYESNHVAIQRALATQPIPRRKPR